MVSLLELGGNSNSWNNLFDSSGKWQQMPLHIGEGKSAIFPLHRSNSPQK